MQKIKFLVFIFLLFFLAVPKTVFAVSQLSVDNLPLTIDQLQEFEADLNFSCPGCSDSYLRGVFYPSGSSYFGYTQDNSGNWSNSPGENCISFFKIAKADLTSEGSWSGKLKFKPDISSSYYSSPGEYLFKVGRYTPSCGSPSVWSQEVTVAITGPTPSQTPTPTSIPSPTSTPTPIPTKTPTPSPVVNSPTPTPIKSTPTPKPTATVFPTSVLGESTKSAEIRLSETAELAIGKNPNNDEKKVSTDFSGNSLPVIFIILGIVFISACGILGFWQFRKSRNLEKNE